MCPVARELAAAGASASGAWAKRWLLRNALTGE
jgi:hypothetical protein